MVEEKSVEPVIQSVANKILNLEKGDWYQIKIHQGKQDLQNAIPKVLPSLSKIPGTTIIILQDQDQNDCIQLKQKLNELVLRSKIKVPYKIRIACRQLENWFLGDLKAINNAYPNFNVNTKISNDVDAIQNADLELLKIIPDFRNHNHLPKLLIAKNISPYLSLSRNKNKSFLNFVSAIKTLIET